jgi:protein-tyrosine phosphatase
MVCLGNICRSPLAEGVLKSKLSSTHFHIDSAATASFHIGKSPDHRSIKVAADHGIDISLQKARVFKLEDFNLFDKIYVMDRNNLKIIKIALFQSLLKITPPGLIEINSTCFFIIQKSRLE